MKFLVRNKKPDSVDIPAPVSTRMFGLSARKSSRNLMYSSGTGRCFGTNRSALCCWLNGQVRESRIRSGFVMRILCVIVM